MRGFRLQQEDESSELFFRLKAEATHIFPTEFFFPKGGSHVYLSA